MYGKSIVALRQELKKEIEWARGELEKLQTSQLKVTVQDIDDIGNLDKGKYIAKATIVFSIDLENTSQAKAVNVQALYFYSANAWTLSQDGKDCAYTFADEEMAQRGFKRRSLLQPPLQFLQKGT